MAIFKCKMCGGTLEINNNECVALCEYCGTKQTIPKSRDEVVSNLYNRANNLRLKCEFDKAEQVYEKILDVDNSDSEAHWGVVLCKYGIEYVEDPKTYSRIPTCHRTLYEPVLTDVDYLAAIENADAKQKELYISEARAIDELQKNILTIVNSEEPFDIFICYKETDEDGKRTVDSAIANDIYYQLTQEGFKVFYAPITLEDKLGYEYEPYIFAALNSVKVMLVLGTKPEYFDSVWVRNEWSRFIKLTKADRSKLIIPCYRNMDAYELPNEFAHLQAQDMGKIGFITDVIRGLKKVFDRDVQPQQIIERNKIKKPSKIEHIIEKWQLKIKERAKYYLRFPTPTLCLTFFIVGLAICSYFLNKDSLNLFDMDVNPSSFFVIFGGTVPFLVLTRIIRKKVWAISLQSVSLAVNILLYSLDMYNDRIDVLVMGLFALLSQVIWFILICFTKRVEKNSNKKANRIIGSIIGAIVSVILIFTLELGALNFLNYQAAKMYFSAGNYEIANLYFASLDNYKDSDNLEKTALHNQTIELIKEGKPGTYIEDDWVIQYKDNNKVLLQYTIELESVGNITDGWKESSLRKYLNGTFYANYVPAYIKPHVVETQIIDSNDPSSASEDKVFILNKNEIEKYNIRFGYGSQFLRDVNAGKYTYCSTDGNIKKIEYTESPAGDKWDFDELLNNRVIKRFYCLPVIWIDISEIK